MSRWHPQTLRMRASRASMSVLKMSVSCHGHVLHSQQWRRSHLDQIFRRQLGYWGSQSQCFRGGSRPPSRGFSPTILTPKLRHPYIPLSPWQIVLHRAFRQPYWLETVWVWIAILCLRTKSASTIQLFVSLLNSDEGEFFAS